MESNSTPVKANSSVPALAELSNMYNPLVKIIQNFYYTAHSGTLNLKCYTSVQQKTRELNSTFSNISWNIQKHTQSPWHRNLPVKKKAAKNKLFLSGYRIKYLVYMAFILPCILCMSGHIIQGQKKPHQNKRTKRTDDIFLHNSCHHLCLCWFWLG